MSLARDPRWVEKEISEAPRLSDLLPLFNGGPLDRLMNRMGFGFYSRAQVLRRTFFWIVLTWLPLLILSWMSGISGLGDLSAQGPDVTFLQDFAVHVRFLIALPILIASERITQIGIGDTPRRFLERAMFPAETLPELAKTEAWMRTLRDSSIAEAALLLLSIGFNLSQMTLELPQEIVSWKMMSTTGSKLAQGWFMWGSMLIYHFFVLRWFWRYVIWSGFLYRVSKLGPRLQSLHPDRVGGLDFLVRRHLRFAVVVLAISSVASANIAEIVSYAGQDVESFTSSLVMYLVIVALVCIGPLLVFTPLLVRAKRDGLHRYDNFASRYSQLFENRWLHASIHENRDLLGTSDVQALNDLGGSHDHLSEMRFILMSRKHLLGLIAFAVIPLLPLILFKVPLLVLLRSFAKSFV